MKKIVCLLMSALIMAMLASCAPNVQIEDNDTIKTESTPLPTVTPTPRTSSWRKI